jgi:hypothetical protein
MLATFNRTMVLSGVIIYCMREWADRSIRTSGFALIPIAPKHLLSDDRPEFVAQDVTGWLCQFLVEMFLVGIVALGYGCKKSFSTRFQEKRVDRESFVGMQYAQWVVYRLRLDHNHDRPQTLLRYGTSVSIAGRCTMSTPKSLSDMLQVTSSLRRSSDPRNSTSATWSSSRTT